MVPILREMQYVLSYFKQYPWGECVIACDDEKVKVKGLKQAEKAMKKLKMV